MKKNSIHILIVTSVALCAGAGGGKDVRVDGKNVRHRHERGDTGDDLGFDRCSIFPQLECVFHQLAKLFHSFLSF